ncbi:CGNR zinc finger domain-containing protein [Streptomyces sp. NBC_00513]|uniref:CGNR zinc finger domain-containing protein n=1 Tax=unclassified Streptomyces TaxID=2593676 RepID=UPI002251EFDD|nr:CGNR zinc finger domain-containing protein [Streptomyces sp. NBC_00424]MCX5077582.1 CGNR zinc finger domain-containing protein [Streptomyces sp. NBC_00424]WUD39445.1 CGNR zinc finger domain-containing protein [Streptomyces sp. NBC_00513]
MVEDEELLLAVLNSAPVVDGLPTDALNEPGAADWLRALGGSGAKEERDRLRRVRDALHLLIRGTSADVGSLASALDGARLRPAVSPAGVSWQLETAPDEEVVVRVVLAWSRLTTELPGRLRACANEECNLFLVDHSRPGTARWCSMAVCGNRVKARTHARKRRFAE